MKEKPTMVVVPIEDWEEYQELKKKRETEETKELELEVGKDYIGKCVPTIVVDRKEDGNSFGFSQHGGFLENISCNAPSHWREATEEEVIEAFEKQCVRRLGVDWREVKLKSHASGNRIALNTGNHVPFIKKGDYNGWIIWNKNGCLYHKGKWAEKLEEPKFAESLEDIDRPFLVDADGIVKEWKYYQYINHLPTKELAEGILVLTQLLSFRHDVWEKEGKPEDDYAWCIANTIKGELEVIQTEYGAFPFSFKTKETTEWFFKTHKKLLIEHFNKLVR